MDLLDDPFSLPFSAEAEVLPQVQSHLTATEVLEEVGKTPDNIHVILAIFAGIAEEDLRPRPEPLPGERRGVRGGLRTLFILLFLADQPINKITAGIFAGL